MLENIWDELLTIIRCEVGSQVVETWLKAVTLRRWDTFEKKVYMEAPNAFVKDWIVANYIPLLTTHLCRLLNVDNVSIVILEQPAQSSEKTSIIPAQRVERVAEASGSAVTKRSTKKRSYINDAHRFDTFVVGANNQLAYAAAHAVTQKLGVLYNPLFIYGNCGLGKTHLLHAIANEVRRTRSKAVVLYQTTERFISEFINAIRFDKVSQFQANYKQLDLLLIDDVQFISGKEQTQEAFFHIFNLLYESQKQIVFTSDTYPSEIVGLAERLRSRLQGGLVTDIQPPSLETKMAILKRKAELNGEQLDDEIAHFIASGCQTNIRELEGAFIRVVAFAHLTKQPISLELAKKILHRVLEPPVKAIDFEQIAACVCEQYTCSLNELRSNDRSKELTSARHIAMYLMKRMTNKSLREISQFLRRKDHSTVLHGVAKVEKRMHDDKHFAFSVRKLEKMLT